MAGAIEAELVEVFGEFTPIIEVFGEFTPIVEVEGLFGGEAYLDPSDTESEGIALLDGENIDDVSPWEFASVVNQAGNELTFDVTAALHESGGYKIAFGGSNPTTYGQRVFAAISDIYARYYFKYPTGAYPFHGASYGNVYHISLRNATRYGITVAIRSSPTLAYVQRVNFALDSGNSYQDFYVPFTIDDAHYIDVRVKAGAGDGIIWAALDGTPFLNLINQTNTVSAGMTISRVGATYGPGSGLGTPANSDYFHMDDILLSTTGPIGAYSPELFAKRLISISGDLLEE